MERTFLWFPGLLCAREPELENVEDQNEATS